MQTEFTTTDILAIIGAVTATIGTVAGVAALAWDVTGGSVLELASGFTVQKDIYVASHDKKVEKPDGPHLLIKVVNTGQSKTVIEDVSWAYFETRWNMWDRGGTDSRSVHYEQQVSHHIRLNRENAGYSYTSRSKV